MARAAIFRRFLFGCLLGAAMAGLMYFATAMRSPLNRWLGDHDAFSLAFVTLNYPGFILGMLATGNYHGPSGWALSIGTFIQWFTIGYLVMWVVQWLRSRRVGDA
jgi:hypothetical protein